MLPYRIKAKESIRVKVKLREKNLHTAYTTVATGIHLHFYRSFVLTGSGTSYCNKKTSFFKKGRLIKKIYPLKQVFLCGE
ncbi:MAG: hypothetical protein JWR61_999 [Ferruginibacter sp.]|nr:hypothetical protein [Ferruginibacter sp.]